MHQKATYHHGDLRAALLEAAFAILTESGVEKLSLRGVARRAGVSPGAPYHHFRDKQAILAELADDRRRRAVKAFGEATDAEAAPRAKLRALGAAYVRYALEHQAEFRLMFGGALPVKQPNAGAGGVPMLELFGTLIRGADGQLSAAEVDAAAVAAWSLVHGLAQLLIDGPLEGLQKNPAQVTALAERVSLVVG